MAGISFGGLASGLPPNIVEQLMNAERIPIKNMENKKNQVGVKLDLVSEAESKLLKFRDSVNSIATVKGFSDMKLASSNETILSGTVDPEAAIPGSWNLKVLKVAEKAGVVSNGFPDKNETKVGVGYIKIKTDDGEKEIYINEENSTLEKMVDAINTKKLGLTASVIKDKKDSDYPYKLILFGVGVGDDADIEFPTLYFLDGDQDFYFEDEKKASNAVIELDGFEMEVEDNKLKDLIPGATLNIHNADKQANVRVTITEDNQIIEGKLKEFVDSANEVLRFVQTQNAMDANTDTSKTLGGDTIIRQIENRMRQVIQSDKPGTGSSIKRLSDLGVEYNRNGLLDFNQDKFNNKLQSQTEDVKKFLVGDSFSTGLIPSVRNQMRSLLDSSFGPISNRKRSLQNNIRNLDSRIESKEKFLEKKEESLKRKFAHVEEMMSKLKSQSNSVGMLK